MTSVCRPYTFFDDLAIVLPPADDFSRREAIVMRASSSSLPDV